MNTVASFRRVQLLLAAVFFITSTVRAADPADANRVWQKEMWDTLVKKHDDPAYLNLHTTGLGIKVLTAQSRFWPFSAGSKDIKSQALRAHVNGTNNDLELHLQKGSSESVLITVMSIWKFKYKFFIIPAGGELQFDDIRIEQIGQQKMGLRLSELMDTKTAAANIMAVFPSDKAVFEGIMDELAGKESPRLNSASTNANQQNAIKTLRDAIAHAKELREKVSMQDSKAVMDAYEKLGIAFDAKAGVMPGTIPADTVAASARFLLEHQQHMKLENAENIRRNIAYMTREDRKAVMEAIGKLKSLPDIPPELGWFIDLSKLGLDATKP